MSSTQRVQESGCRDFRVVQRFFQRRRELLRIGGVSLLSPGLANVLAGQAMSAVREPKIKSCLVLFQAGGVSHIDTFDMKPDQPINIRGEFSPISSNVPGMPVCEHLPRVSRQMDKLCVVRSMYHKMLCHNPAAYCALSGREVGEAKAVSNKTNAKQDDYPNFGSVIAKYRPSPRDLPSFVQMPFTLFNGPAKTPGQNAGFLGREYDPFLISQNPNDDNFRVDELQSQPDMNRNRFGHRQSLLQSLDAKAAAIERTGAVETMDVYYQRAFSLLTTPRSKKAFDLSQEPQQVRERYGRNIVGQSTLLGRRLIEAGVPFVTVYSPVDHIEKVSWDTHRNNFPLLKDTLLPPADQSLSALLEDMQQRGLLDQTLVVWMGEFGRSPRIGFTQSNNTNNQNGRDHHPQCYTILLAGGGVRGGTYCGSSDRQGWYPKENPIHSGDLGATIFEAFGIDHQSEVRDNLNRPHRLSEGVPIQGIY